MELSPTLKQHAFPSECILKRVTGGEKPMSFDIQRDPKGSLSEKKNLLYRRQKGGLK